jgi:hypothetical protein
MSAFILAWVLVSFDSYSTGMIYSPAVETLEDCQRLQAFRKIAIRGVATDNSSQCVQLRVMRGVVR